MSGHPTAADVFGPQIHRDFQARGDGRFVMCVPAYGVKFDIDRLRRNTWGELIGELAVTCELAGVRTTDGGLLSVADFNLSSARTREDRGRLLAKRSKADDVDWVGLIEIFCQQILAAERRGKPAILLRDLPRPVADTSVHVEGLPLLMRHPIIVFGDGGAAKSYMTLYLAGRLEQEHGVRVGLFDWELAADDHRDRLERLFGAHMPSLRYVRCDRPLVHELDRLKRIVREEALDYVVLDSIAFACDGPPEAAEVAGRYFQAVRQLGIVGSLHVAHISKAEGADQKPFGSAFWHNGARATWFVKLAEGLPGSSQITIGLYNRKANLGGLKPAIGFEIAFAEQHTTFRRVEVADVIDLAGQLSVRQRMAHLLRKGAMDVEVLADEIGADAETVKRTARRYKQQFTSLPGGNLGLLEKRAC